MNAQSKLWRWSVLPVWVLAAAGTVIALVQVNRIQGLAVVLICGVLATFLAQLATRTPAGFVARARFSVMGVVSVVALGGVFAAVLGSF